MCATMANNDVDNILGELIAVETNYWMEAGYKCTYVFYQELWLSHSYRIVSHRCYLLEHTHVRRKRGIGRVSIAEATVKSAQSSDETVVSVFNYRRDRETAEPLEYVYLPKY